MTWHQMIRSIIILIVRMFVCVMIGQCEDMYILDSKMADTNQPFVHHPSRLPCRLASSGDLGKSGCRRITDVFKTNQIEKFIENAGFFDHLYRRPPWCCPPCPGKKSAAVDVTSPARMLKDIIYIYPTIYICIIYHCYHRSHH